MLMRYLRLFPPDLDINYTINSMIMQISVLLHSSFFLEGNYRGMEETAHTLC